ncbi:hypothetical protein FACS189492_1530 [Clostridia bacterium]|nr:hypothetical protein FACS189492_1530 [Clostridia bacterium]
MQNDLYFENTSTVNPEKSGKYMLRPRVNNLMGVALSRRILVVIAGAGCGKTCAVYQFLCAQSRHAYWIQLSEKDNLSSRFWENFVHTFHAQCEVVAGELRDLGFPETDAQLERYFALCRRHVRPKRYVLVFDDLHLISNASVLRFIEYTVRMPMPEMRTVLISRKEPAFRLDDLEASGTIARIFEEQLRFSDEESRALLSREGVELPAYALDEIDRVTGGWPVAVSLICAHLKKEPTDVKTALAAMENNIFSLMETQVFAALSEKARKLLLKLSLIDHLAGPLARALEPDAALVRELTGACSLVRYDAYHDVLRIHHMFLDFLVRKQNLLSASEKRETYRKTANWCVENNFLLDASANYEKLGDYKGLCVVLNAIPISMPSPMAEYFVDLIDQVSAARVEGHNVFHALLVYVFRPSLLRVLGRYQEATAAANATIIEFERKSDVPYASVMLYSSYNNLGFVGMNTCLFTKQYDFYRFFIKAHRYYSLEPLEATGAVTVGAVASCVCMVGAPAHPGEFEKYIEAVSRAVPHISTTVNGMFHGLDDLARCEYLLYRGEFSAAADCARQAAVKARYKNQYEIETRAMFLLIRAALPEGRYPLISEAREQLNILRADTAFVNRRELCDLVDTWFLSQISHTEAVLGRPKNGLKGSGLSPGMSMMETYVGCKYYLAEKQYSTVLSILHNTRLDVSAVKFVITETEFQCIEAVCLHRCKDNIGALVALVKACRLAEPLGFVTPFLELGKYMRPLLALAAADADCGISPQWLARLKNSCATYAKRQETVALNYRQENNLTPKVDLSPRDVKILTDLYQGMSRSQIAAAHHISINTVKTALLSIYAKLGAENNVDAVRIAMELGLVKKTV